MNDPECERLLRVYESAGWVRMVRDLELWLRNVRKLFEIVTLQLGPLGEMLRPKPPKRKHRHGARSWRKRWDR